MVHDEFDVSVKIQIFKVQIGSPFSWRSERAGASSGVTRKISSSSYYTEKNSFFEKGNEIRKSITKCG